MSAYGPGYTRASYDAYGDIEWSRLEATAYGRLQAVIHTDFIRRYVGPGDRVLDAGCGPGRFSIVVAELGATVTALDLSDVQLQLAKERLGEADLSMFQDGHFDVVICYGGALSYVCAQRHRAASELVRVVRPEGFLLTSVMSRYGLAANLVRSANMGVLEDPEGEQVWRAVKDGDRSAFLSPRVNMQHPPMHVYTSEELRQVLPGCTVLELAGSNVTAVEGSKAIDEVLSDQRAWSTAVRLERELNSRPGLVDSGGHIIMAAQRL